MKKCQYLLNKTVRFFNKIVKSKRTLTRFKIKNFAFEGTKNENNTPKLSFINNNKWLKSLRRICFVLVLYQNLLKKKCIQNPLKFNFLVSRSTDMQKLGKLLQIRCFKRQIPRFNWFRLCSWVKFSNLLLHKRPDTTKWKNGVFLLTAM